MEAILFSSITVWCPGSSANTMHRLKALCQRPAISWDTHIPVSVLHNSSPTQQACPIGGDQPTQPAACSAPSDLAGGCSFSSRTRNTRHLRPAHSPKSSKAAGAGNQYCNSTSWSLLYRFLFEMMQDKSSHNPDFICVNAIKV